MLDKSEMIFGVRAVIEAIQAGKEIDKILVKKDIQSDLSKELFAALKGTLIPVQRVTVERINRITRKNHQGVIAFISSVTYQKTEDLVPFLFEQGKNPFFVMLDIVTTGQKATDTLRQQFNVEEPKVGDYSEFIFEGRAMRLYRMPSSSRAYPLALDKKATAYRIMYQDLQILS